MTKKTKPLTKLEKAERRIVDLEYAVAQMAMDMQEVSAQLRVLKTYIQSPDYSQYTTKDFIGGILTTLHGNVEFMMINADLEQ